MLEPAQTARLDEVSAPTPDDHPYGPCDTVQRSRVHSSDAVLGELF